MHDLMSSDLTLDGESVTFVFDTGKEKLAFSMAVADYPGSLSRSHHVLIAPEYCMLTVPKESEPRILYDTLKNIIREVETGKQCLHREQLF